MKGIPLVPICILTLLGSLAPAVCRGASPTARPNIILLMTDDQGYGDLGCHGNPVLRTPHLDRLQDESVRFTDFHVAPMCTPTRGQLLTGVDALRNGAMNVSSGRTLLRTRFPTLAHYLGRAGYATGLFGKWHLGDNYPYRPQDRGFAESVWFPSSHINSLPDWWDNDYFDDTYWHNGRRTNYKGYTTDVFFREAMDWMRRQVRAGKPFFCYLPTAAAHWPHFVPGHHRLAVEKRLASALPKLPKLTSGQQGELARFLAMIENIDTNLGRLEGFLQKTGLRENTVLVFLTDNGSTMGPRYYNAGMRGGKVTLWEGGHRVPLFIRWPAGGLGEPRELAGLTQVQDLAPTLLDFCGVKPVAKPEWDGMSLAPLLRGDQEYMPDRMLVVNYSRMPFGVTQPSENNPAIPRKEGAAVLWQRWRLLENKELYDLKTDPAQERNVIEDYPGVVQKMREHLDQWWERVQPGLNDPARVVIGAPADNPTLLTACEWFDVFVDQQRQVRRADLKNGVWHLVVDRPGTYELELRRWPRETGLPLQSGLPATRVADGEYVPGKALPIVRARLRIGALEMAQDLTAGTPAARFTVPLEAGPVEMQTWLEEAGGTSLLGAYYVYVNRLQEAGQ